MTGRLFASLCSVTQMDVLTEQGREASILKLSLNLSFYSSALSDPFFIAALSSKVFESDPEAAFC